MGSTDCLRTFGQHGNQGGLVGEHDPRIKDCHDAGHQAVDKADPSQLPVYDAPLTRRDPIHALEERAERLQEILNRL
jgi:hypothetical protein